MQVGRQGIDPSVEQLYFMSNEFGLSASSFQIVKYLRSAKDVKIMEGIMADKRVEVVKGMSFI